MIDTSHILQLIKNSIKVTAPEATLILYGSYARGDFREDSDIDLLILVDNEIIAKEENKITFPLYNIGFKTGYVINPMVYTKEAWINHRVTPFYENVNRDGKLL